MSQEEETAQASRKEDVDQNKVVCRAHVIHDSGEVNVPSLSGNLVVEVSLAVAGKETGVTYTIAICTYPDGTVRADAYAEDDMRGTGRFHSNVGFRTILKPKEYR